VATIFHLALASDWDDAQATGSYLISTRGRTLAEQGFIHASRGDQWPAVQERFYADVTAPMVLLQIDTDRLGVPVVEEPGEPGGTETFPHIYGPLPVAAVVKAIPLGSSAAPPAPATPTPSSTTSASPRPAPAQTPPRGSFAKAYFGEMLTNAVLVLLVIALSVVGGSIGSAIDNQRNGEQGAFGLGGAIVGLVVGAALAVVIYRRRK